MNNLSLVGNLTRDLEIINTNSGTMLAKTGLAVNKKVQGVDKTMFIDITFFGKTAEVAMNYLHKGSKVAVSGSLELDQWDDAQTGAKRSKHTMAVNQMTMLDSNPNAGQGGQPQQQYNNQQPQQQNGGYNQQNNGGGYQQPQQQYQPPQQQYDAPQQQPQQPQQQQYGGQQQMDMNQNQGGNMPQFGNQGNQQ